MTNLELLKIDNNNELDNVKNMITLQEAIEIQILKVDETLKNLKLKGDTNKALLLEQMQKYDIKTLESDKFKITRVDETTRTTVDSKSLKENEPEIYEKYSKTSIVKANLRITTKTKNMLEAKND